MIIIYIRKPDDLNGTQQNILYNPRVMAKKVLQSEYTHFSSPLPAHNAQIILYLGIDDLLRLVLGGGVSRLELLFILLRILTVILCRSSRGIPIINNADCFVVSTCVRRRTAFRCLTNTNRFSDYFFAFTRSRSNETEYLSIELQYKHLIIIINSKSLFEHKHLAICKRPYENGVPHLPRPHFFTTPRLVASFP